jgi:anti-sigma B factor antagonist
MRQEFPMRVEFEPVDGGIMVIRCHGRFATGIDAAYLRQRCDELKSTGCRFAVADLESVPYIDSTGIGFLVAVHSGLSRLGGRLVMASLTPFARETLQITRLLDVMIPYPSVQAALEALRAPVEAAQSATSS